MSDDFNLADELNMLDEELTSNRLPDVGSYVFEVVTAEFRYSTNNVPNINMRVRFVDGKYKGQSNFITLYYSKKTDAGIKMFWRQLGALGVTHEWIRENNATLADAANQVVGAQFNGRLTHREFRGNDEVSIFPNKFVGFNPDARTGLDDSAADTHVAELEDLDDEGVTPPPAAPATNGTVNTQKTPATVPASAPDEDDPWG